uniref:Serine/threonine protein kinase n=1 Tax=Streptomyces sp. NBC_01393 TaxID=2903851 RepID=A0AAU3I9I1_9ACTN
MTRPQSPPDPYARPQRPVRQAPGDSHRSALVVALIGAAATIVAALIGLFVQLSGDVEQRASGPSLGGASPASDAPGVPDTFVAPRSSVPPSTPAAPGVSGGADGTQAAPTPTAPTSVGLPEEFLGRWQGYAEEADAASTDHYRVTVELDQGTLRERVGSVHYAMESSDCYGTVTLTAVGGTDQVTLGESIQSGNCVTNGRITLTLRLGDTVDFAYESTKRDGTRQSVKAGLERVA